MEFLDKIRTPEKTNSIKTRIFAAIVIFVLGICLGTFSKFLDYRQAELSALIQAFDQALDFHNFLGGFAPWLNVAMLILGIVILNRSLKETIIPFHIW